MADPYWLFRAALLPIGYLSATYVAWPVSVIAAALVYFRFRPNPGFRAALQMAWWILMITGVVLALSLAVAYVTKPKNDRELAAFFYYGLVAALPILISAVVAAFCNPKKKVVNFFVAMPLDWGDAVKPGDGVGKFGGVVDSSRAAPPEPPTRQQG
jgi:hypothetical protein